MDLNIHSETHEVINVIDSLKRCVERPLTTKISPEEMNRLAETQWFNIHGAK